MADMKLGQPFCTIEVEFREGDVSEAELFVPVGWHVVDCRVLASEPGLVALVRDGGRVIFRTPAMVFEDSSDALAFAEGKTTDEIADALRTALIYL